MFDVMLFSLGLPNGSLRIAGRHAKGANRSRLLGPYLAWFIDREPAYRGRHALLTALCSRLPGDSPDCHLLRTDFRSRNPHEAAEQ